MIKFIKKIFNSENFKKAMIYSSFTDSNITVSEYVDLMGILKEMDQIDEIENIQLVKKVA